MRNLFYSLIEHELNHKRISQRISPVANIGHISESGKFRSKIQFRFCLPGRKQGSNFQCFNDTDIIPYKDKI